MKRDKRVAIRSKRPSSALILICTSDARAKIINFSQDGMYFVSDMEFHPGSAVLIQAKNDSPHQKMPENTEGLRQTTLAEVRWCRQVSEKPTHYQVGVKYYESWY
jgi:hypothetical protein